jgi:hypothetical protein
MWTFLSSLQSACAVLYYLWPLGLYRIFHIPQKRHDFWKNVTKHKMCVLIFSTPFFFSYISHSKNNSERLYHKCTLVVV